MTLVPDAINPSEFINTSHRGSSPQGMLDALMSQRGKVSGRLTAERAANSHLQVLEAMMGNISPAARLDTTAAGSMQYKLGRHTVHIPTFSARSRAVLLGGVKYAPMAQMVWDGNRFQYMSAQGALEHALRGLGPGIKGRTEADQVDAIREVIRDWKDRSLQHVRFNAKAAGGALPYYLAHQVRFPTSGPMGEALKGPIKLFELGRGVDNAVLDAIIASTGQARAKGTGAFGFQGGLSYQESRRALIRHLALAMETLSQEGVESIGVKTLRMTGYNAVGTKRAMGAEGRLIASTMPTWGYGLDFPGTGISGQLKKSIHHMRSRGFLPLRELAALRDAEILGIPAASNTAYHMKKLAVQRGHGAGMGAARNVTPALRSGWEFQARLAAGDHYATQTIARGTKVRGVLSTPLKTLGIGVRGNLTREQAEVAYKLMNQLFTDSTAYVSSEYAAGVFKIHQQMLEMRHLPMGKLTSGAGPMGGQMFDVHPLVDELLKQKGTRGPVFFSRAIRKKDLFAHADGQWGEGWIGSALSSDGTPLMKGDKRVQMILGKKDKLLGFEATDQGLRPLIERGERKLNQGAPILLGPKRMGVGGSLQAPGDLVVAMDVAGRQYIDPIKGAQVLGEHGLGIESGEMNFRVATEINDLRMHQGGLQRLSKNFPELQVRQERVRYGGAVRTEEVLHYRGKDKGLDFGELMSAVRRTRKEMGLSDSAVHHIGLGELETQFMTMLGPAARREMKRVGLTSLGDALDVTVGWANAATRAGQPVRGTFGTVRYTLRDLNMWTVQQAAMGGADVETMNSNRIDTINRIAARRGATISEKRAKRLSRAFGRYRSMARNSALNVGTPDRHFLQARLDIAKGTVGKSHHYEVMTWDDYRKKFTQVVRDYQSGGDLEQFRGTHLVEDINGTLMPTRKSIIIDMGQEGLVPLERKLQGASVRSRFLALPGGQSLGLKAGEPAYLVQGVGDFPGLGHETLDAIRALHGGDAGLAFEAAGRAGLSGEEKLMARGHKAFGRKLKQSFGGTLVHNSKLQVGEIGISRSRAVNMLKNAGFTGGEAKARVRAIMSGKDMKWKGKTLPGQYYATFKTEPMRGAQESTVAKIRIINAKGRGGVMSTAGQWISHSEAIQVAPGWLPERFRDTDHDPGYLYNLAQGSGKRLERDFAQEQMWKRFEYQHMRAEYDAVHSINQLRMVNAVSKGATKEISSGAYENLMKEAFRLMSDDGRRKGARYFSQSIAATLAAGPELLTPVANLRWRRMTQMMSSIAGGASLADFDVAKGANSKSRMVAEQAIAYAKGDMSALKWMLRVAEESEYQVLKKEKVLDLMFGNADMLALGDPRVMALSHAEDLLHPGNKKAFKSAVDDLAQALIGMSENSGAADFIGTFAQTEGVTPQHAASRIAKIIAAGRQIEEAAAESHMEFLQRFASAAERGEVRGVSGGALSKIARLLGQNPEFAQRAMGGYVGPVGDAARTAVQGAPAGGVPAMTGRSIGFAEHAMDLAKKLWGTNYGKGIMIGGAAIMGIGLLQTINGGGSSGAHGSGAMGGAPMPPPPMIRPNTMDARNMTIPTTDFAYMDRPSQVRTQMHFSTGTMNRSTDFMAYADASMGELGLAPMQQGLMYDTTAPMALRHTVDATIRQRMRSSF